MYNTNTSAGAMTSQTSDGCSNGDGPGSNTEVNGNLIVLDSPASEDCLGQSEIDVDCPSHTKMNEQFKELALTTQSSDPEDKSLKTQEEEGDSSVISDSFPKNLPSDPLILNVTSENIMPLCSEPVTTFPDICFKEDENPSIINYNNQSVNVHLGHQENFNSNKMLGFHNELPSAPIHLNDRSICQLQFPTSNGTNVNTLGCKIDDSGLSDYGIRYVSYESELQMCSIMKLIQKDLSEPYSVYTYRYFIHNWPKLCFLAMDGDTMVGVIVCKLDVHKQINKRGYIAMLAVDENFRRKKIGSSLVLKSIRAMAEEDADEIVLETEITNKSALRLYENLGFVRDKRLFRYYLNGVDALRLKLWLK